MARIVLSTFGSTGDLNPFIALGLTLRDRGHEVTFAVQDLFAPAVESQGFAVRHVSGNVVAALAQHTTQRQWGASNPIPSLRALMRYGIMPTLDAQAQELRDACQGADLLVTSYGQLAGCFAAELAQIPWATVALSPATVPSAYITSQPPPIDLPPNLQSLSNRVQWGIGSLVLGRIADRPINRVRARYHLKPIRESLWLGAASRQLVCVACSPSFQPAPPDWPDCVRMTGFCFWDAPSTWEPPETLTAFLADERPYVVVTAGSIAPDLQSAFASYFETSIKAITAAGARVLAIVLTEASQFTGEGVLSLPFAPYSRIFPRAVAIIHHGGIGTTAQALRLGVPSLIVPWGFDQLYTAARITTIGAGQFLFWRDYTPARAQKAISALLNEPSYRATARSLSERIAHEDGVGTLCDAVLALL